MMTNTRKIFAGIAAVATALLCAAQTIAADADWLATARTMAAEGEASRMGNSAETGGYIMAIARIPETGDAAEAMSAARIAAKRMIAGIAGGENVEAAEIFSTSETTGGDEGYRRRSQQTRKYLSCRRPHRRMHRFWRAHDARPRL